jgi:hypothetical protein
LFTFFFCGVSQLWKQILGIKFHIRCAYFTPKRTWSPNYSVLVSPSVRKSRFVSKVLFKELSITLEETRSRARAGLLAVLAWSVGGPASPKVWATKLWARHLMLCDVAGVHHRGIRVQVGMRSSLFQLGFCTATWHNYQQILELEYFTFSSSSLLSHQNIQLKLLCCCS